MEKRIDPNAFEDEYADFIDRAVRYADGKPFTGFDHPLVSPSESYKKEVHSVARGKLLIQFWKPTDIGTGRIHREVLSALKTQVRHRGLHVVNNLLDWRLKDDFAKGANTKAMEQVLFELFKSKASDQDLFEKLQVMGHQYQFIAYLFFLKDKQRYLPISQQGFDRAFDFLGVEDFKTSGNTSWSNYTTFIDLIKQVQALLMTKLSKPVDLLDAHSFTWTIGHTFPKWAGESNEDEEEKEQEGANPTAASMGADAPSSAAPIAIQPEFEAALYPEGRERFIEHRKAEHIRNPELVRAAKEQFLARDPNMCCEVCGYSFFLTFGAAGAGYIEAHHTVPVHTMQPGHKSRVEDLAMVCSNCHVMLHRIDPLPTIEELRQRLLDQRQE
ncbi:MAG: HNH endonuclease [Flavobacteriales bacterium]|nr:HNH endonuclease [Flavobacteriales bacterium]